MVSQGFWGALVQYWTLEDKPRLTRRNTWFRDHKPKTVNLNTFLFIWVFGVIMFMVFCIMEASV